MEHGEPLPPFQRLLPARCERGLRCGLRAGIDADVDGEQCFVFAVLPDLLHCKHEGFVLPMLLLQFQEPLFHPFHGDPGLDHILPIRGLPRREPDTADALVREPADAHQRGIGVALFHDALLALPLKCRRLRRLERLRASGLGGRLLGLAANRLVTFPRRAQVLNQYLCPLHLAVAGQQLGQRLGKQLLEACPHQSLQDMVCKDRCALSSLCKGRGAPNPLE
mmetsp:Transcript_106794/g.238329  ORF Transcript_106794/g.238329 Transcript_106794/m.238329 type:complete len:222 (-) Transcript_106794:330-995(-)